MKIELTDLQFKKLIELLDAAIKSTPYDSTIFSERFNKGFYIGLKENLESQRILNNDADVKSFGDPVEWQKKEREDRKID